MSNPRLKADVENARIKGLLFSPRLSRIALGSFLMASFPLIKDLPQVLDATGWQWMRFEASSAPSHDFWLGIDREGNRWLTKLKGFFYAYREIVFARIAQKMKWSCQSSAFLHLDAQSAAILGVSTGEVHAAHWFMDEHVYPPCSSTCSLKFLIGKSIETVDDLSGSNIAHLLDWPKSEFAACLFGGNEPPGRLFTAVHEFVIIDSEQMFSTGPCELDGTSWWNRPDGQPSSSGRALALEVCREVSCLSEADVEDALLIPKGVSVRKQWPIAPKLRASRKFATDFCATYAGA